MVIYNLQLRIIIQALILMPVWYTYSASSEKWQGKNIHHLAMFKYPITDLFINAPTLPLEKQPASPYGPPSQGKCKRAHQALAHEVVTRTNHSGDLVEVALDNLYYGIDEKTKRPLNTFWVEKSQLIFLTHLHDNPEALFAIPSPMYAHDPTIVLTFPWGVYSVGTRFVHVPSEDTPTTYGAYGFDPETMKPFLLNIPKQDALKEHKKNDKKTRQLFIAVLNNLIDRVEILPGNQCTPYVWGGSSCTKNFSIDGNYCIDHGVWTRPYDGPVLTGYDCSELPLRMAQIAGIPFPFKTSHIIREHGTLIQPHHPLQNGDIIWVPGHVIIIVNLAKNEIAQARGYASGYGKLYRTQLKNYFKDIHTFKQLRNAYEKQLPLTILNRDGSIERTVTEFRLIKLC